MTMKISRSTYFYGKDKSQNGELFVPECVKHYKILCLVHGGFWKYPYDRLQMTALANELATLGYVVWNIEYRRVGEDNGGWPNTFNDVIDAVNYLHTLDVENSGVILIGHSAGGHLALWLSQQQLHIPIINVIALAPVSDLLKCTEEHIGGQAVEELLKTVPSENRQRYVDHSPIEQEPSHIPETIIHGSMDEYVPIEMSRCYVKKRMSQGCHVIFHEVSHGLHLDFLDPSSASTAKLFDVLS